MSHLGALFYSFSRNFKKISYLSWFELVLGGQSHYVMISTVAGLNLP
jgi:hypothetical protein